MELLSNINLLLVHVLVVFELFVQCMHGTLQMLVHSDVHSLVVLIHQLSMLCTVIYRVIVNSNRLLC